MVDHRRSPETAIAIGAALEAACAAGNLEVAERLFESYRLLFVEYHNHKASAARALPGSEGARSSASPRIVLGEWWGKEKPS